MDLTKPGEELGTEEEFLKGTGTYLENEKICSLLLGEKKIEDRKMTVDRPYRYRNLHRGVLVFGRIEKVSDQMALASIIPIDQKIGRYPKTNDYASLHVSNVKQGFVDSLKNEVKIGDIIKAIVINVDIRKGQIEIATDKPNLGVVKAFCSKCRNILKKEDNTLVCEQCGFKDNRVISNDYRNLALK
ncbi:exosome complex RNA-binding protein Csl4 [Candidatus Micrarchaeota archaeon]|jgi:exosome complex component CSL4|nr:exosome complex RNA-binding protein Csl4 [Candidatus Micrarchaeota archaeon]